MIILQIGEKFKLHHYFKTLVYSYWTTYSYSLYWRINNYRIKFRIIPKFHSGSKDRRRFLFKIERIWRNK